MVLRIIWPMATFSPNAGISWTFCQSSSCGRLDRPELNIYLLPLHPTRKSLFVYQEEWVWDRFLLETMADKWGSLVPWVNALRQFWKPEKIYPLWSTFLGNLYLIRAIYWSSYMWWFKFVSRKGKFSWKYTLIFKHVYSLSHCILQKTKISKHLNKDFSRKVLQQHVTETNVQVRSKGRHCSKLLFITLLHVMKKVAKAYIK